MIKYDKLFARLTADGKSSTAWLRENGMHPSVVNKLRKNERVNTDTIDRLCSLLNCQPGDIMEYKEDKIMSIIEITEKAASLYDGGWRAEDRDQLIAEYSLTETEADAICKALAEMEAED